MQKVIWYVFILILVFIIVAYYKGFTQDVQTTGGAVARIILYLQGRNNNGTLANYPR
jgi:hypothetical protein